MPLIYLNLDDAIKIHRKTVEISGGGSIEHLDIGKLKSVLEHIQNDDYYPSFEEKLTHLFFCTCQFHCFADGNKRIAIALSAHFLVLNGYIFIAGKFIPKMENISYHVAAGKISKELLYEYIVALMNCDEDNESIKLKLMIAISN